MQPNSARRLLELVVASAAEKPMRERARIYRDAATILAGPKDAATLLKMAEEIEHLDQRMGQMRLEFAA